MTVFISHSRENSGAALKLAQQLSERGIDTWLDTLQLEGGESWRESVAKAIDGASGFVVLVGPSPETDSSQRFEWQKITDGEIYLDTSKALVPIVLGSPEIPGFLRTRNFMSIEPSGIDFAALAGRVALSLGRPAATIDQEQLGRGREARKVALENLHKFSQSLGADDIKRAGLRGLE